jgi:alpha-1,2-mannosyltransferase
MKVGRPRRRTVGQVLVVTALAAAVAAFVAAFSDRHSSIDLRIYYQAVNFWAHGHGSIYDYRNNHTGYAFTYPPFAALAMLPMAVLPWGVVHATSQLGTVAVTLLIVYWFVDPVARRYGWTRWFAWAVASCLAFAFEPLRETLSFGQVNMFLLALVLADARLLIGRGSRSGARLGGLGIGLAAAVKLTPAVFIGYLLIARKWRAAGVAAGTFVAASAFAALAGPGQWWAFWSRYVWDARRVGSQDYVSNQSLRGFVARLDPAHPSTALWLALVAVAVLAWAWRARRAARLGDDWGGVALTAVLGCLISPITWIHHLVWLFPALFLLADRALPARGRPRAVLLVLAGGLYALLCSRAVWPFQGATSVGGLALASTYVYASGVLLLALPLRRRASTDPVGSDYAEPEPGYGRPEAGYARSEGSVLAPQRITATRSPVAGA